MNALSKKVIADVHLFLETVYYNRNQVVFYEGQKSEFILFVKSGTFEMTKTFSKE